MRRFILANAVADMMSMNSRVYEDTRNKKKDRNSGSNRIGQRQIRKRAKWVK